MTTSVIVAGARTPIGRLGGALAPLGAVELGAHAVKAALARAGVAPEQVEYVLMGQVLQAGLGQLPARQAAVAAGIPLDVPAVNVNKVCLSGIDAIATADLLIRSGAYEVVVAGGMESMTNAPLLLPGLRAGYRGAPPQLLDSATHDGLTDAFQHIPMGAATDRRGPALGLTRAEQDAYALESHRRAAEAQRAGRLDAEIAPIPVPQRRGAPLLVSADEGVRADSTPEQLARLAPSFDPGGTITAASSSPLSDGACALVLTSARKAAELGLEPLAEVGPHASVAGPDTSLHSQPSRAIRRLLDRTGLAVADLDLIEINEAFSAVALKSMKDLGIDSGRVNTDGGALALGHPIGMSGARLVLHLAHALKRRGGGTGAAALCGGGGQGDALLLTVPR
ncbi:MULTISPECIES: acetyl-CoA C-acetyltransferase [Kitasatospora]|uniref:Probable acetyl-CoA acetyltransferase n=1 Tax=Kitasatospora setae (strain ATCC 33774 / DSM 43861 / JCM 3304 / KCC A-0304 / NBRC 14216 / KM-6054) TaxID=452652 RepID=E4N5Y2_KITSK|nr:MULTISPECIES: acetyl-CoA C-acetyltransferase [Kitasatospora]BAJ26613.1 putative acetyl-CoA acetyltransferase [Kitasatospora setae KM-6054]